MEIFFYILANNIAPIFLIIYLGYIMEKKFALDINSFSKLNFYIFVPAIIFDKVYQTEIKAELLKAILFGFLFLAALTVIAIVISKFRKLSISTANAFKNSIMFYNCGNFALPLIALVFRNSPMATYAMSVQIMILMVQSLTTSTIGFYNAGRGQMNYKETIKAIAKMPPLYAMLMALVFKFLPFDITQFFLWPAVDYFRDGFIAVALLTLGIQLSLAKINIKDLDVYLASFVRLVGGPVLAYFLIKLLGIEGIMAQTLFISSSVPSAVNTALIAVEFDNKPDFASQVVLTTTLMSSITLTGVIYLSRMIF